MLHVKIMAVIVNLDLLQAHTQIVYFVRKLTIQLHFASLNQEVNTPTKIVGGETTNPPWS